MIHKVLFALIFVLMSFSYVSAQNTVQPADSGLFKVRLSKVINNYQRVTVPVMKTDGSRLYFDRKLHPENTGGLKDPDEIWYSDKTRNGYMTLPKKDTSIWNTEFSDVLFSLSPDGQNALLYGEYDSDNKYKGKGYSVSFLKAGIQSTPQALKIKNYYNYSDYFFGNMSSDGRVLFMSAQRDDSYGGLDLYVSLKDSAGNWSEPQNLGAAINTSAEETAPFYAYDGKTLYFASDTGSAAGGFDLYMTRRLSEDYIEWSKPVNLGNPINSKYDENSICLTAMSDSAYIISSDDYEDRTGIYCVGIPKDFSPLGYRIVRGKVWIKSGQQKILCTNPTVINVKYEGLPTNYKYQSLKGEFLFVVPNNVNALIRAEEHGFEDFVFSVSTMNADKPEFYNRDIIFHKELKFDSVLTTVYFENDSDVLSAEAEETIYSSLMKFDDISLLKFNVIGHADEAGTDEYNFDLSVRRGDNTASFLKKLGIKNENIYFTGKGEQEPQNSERNKNRRVTVYLAQ